MKPPSGWERVEHGWYQNRAISSAVCREVNGKWAAYRRDDENDKIKPGKYDTMREAIDHCELTPLVGNGKN